uniref:Aminotransferase-like plant mobile domain-containing protein n=1 Tax=Cucumis melo TaxID=3656 RepID=A0A9I9E2G3_CUCME
MVYFTERFLSGVRHLVILSDRNQPREDGLSLIVEKPWAGAFADHWPRLDNNSVLPRLSVEIPLSEGKSAWILQSSIHHEAPNSGRALTLGQRLIEGQTRWGTVTKVPREFCFTDCYWEWLELVVGRNTRLLYSTRLYGAVTASLYTYDRNSDVVRAFCEAWCPSTNTLHTMAGELSISLWDLWSFGGLPIKGDFYEERIPSFKELTSTSRDKTKCLPTTCQYLFQAYYSIVCTQRNDRSTSSKNDSQVTIGSWISFWYLGTRSYDKPTTRKQKNASRSKSTQNPDGSKIQAREWSSRESMLFAELGIKDDLKDETYLAAFLSCWLCLFVFPQKGSFLRPGVFRAASLMTAGTIYSLAVPVLANIYHGLGLITKASNPTGRMDFHFPMHYVHGWLAHYFGTHYPLPTEVRGPKMTNFSGEGGSIYFGEYEARKLIHNGARIQWHANLQNISKHERMVDTHDSSFLQMSYFVSMRSCYLSSRCENTWIITSYSPYRFGRQFGFYQDLPNDIGGMPPAITLDNILYH